ncbi:hypothetical protein [Hymenobacter sp. GOD-10R]|nr:hypothetical protein [Hymenobacter sp. GOD-10R]WRQ28258.1 hypothetical protein SD425_24635 [Hymenobacter sp. GOD-10R]
MVCKQNQSVTRFCPDPSSPAPTATYLGQPKLGAVRLRRLF